jgi:hypothetical protein
MALDETPHHVGLARRAERGAGFLGLLDRDQSFDDLAALDQKRVHRLVDPVDFATQLGKWGFVLARRFHALPGQSLGLIGVVRPESKEKSNSNQRKH